MYERRPGFFREDAPPGRRIEAKVKWFNASKGFGFITPIDGSQDAFLPMAVLRRAGYEDVREGSSISCEVSEGARGPLVTTIYTIDESTATAPGTGLDRRPPRAATTLEGAVKWFEPEKGYGSFPPMAAGGTCLFTSPRCAAAALAGSSRVSVSGSKSSKAERGRRPSASPCSEPGARPPIARIRSRRRRLSPVPPPPCRCHTPAAG